MKPGDIVQIDAGTFAVVVSVTETEVKACAWMPRRGRWCVPSVYERSIIRLAPMEHPDARSAAHNVRINHGVIPYGSPVVRYVRVVRP